jgi:tetratricopeptide (TPR) repeat protein
MLDHILKLRKSSVRIIIYIRGQSVPYAHPTEPLLTQPDLMTYYKYRTDSKFTEQIFTTGKIFLSNAQGLNDPFECSLQEIGHEWIDSPVLLNLKGIASGFSRNHEKALGCFVKLCEICPEVAQPWYRVSCALIELGRHNEAIQALRKVYELDSNNASITFILGLELLRTQKDTEEAISLLEKADKLGHRRAFAVLSQIKT